MTFQLIELVVSVRILMNYDSLSIPALRTKLSLQSRALEQKGNATGTIFVFYIE